MIIMMIVLVAMMKSPRRSKVMRNRLLIAILLSMLLGVGSASAAVFCAATTSLCNLGNAPYPLSGVDLVGNPRIVQSAPELGAYEILDFLFVDGFDGEQ